MCVCVCVFFLQNIPQLKTHQPYSYKCFCYPKRSDFLPLCLSLLLIPCEINHNCLLSQHENHLTGIYPEILSRLVSQLALGLGEGRERAQQPNSGSQGLRSSPIIRQNGPMPHAQQQGKSLCYCRACKNSHSSQKDI